MKAVVITGAGGNFCSGGDVHDIIGPLTRMTMPELIDFQNTFGLRIVQRTYVTAEDARAQISDTDVKAAFAE